MKFLVVTNAPTLRKGKKYVAYAPYVNEMDIWFENVEKVGIISPATYPQPIFGKPFIRQDIKFFRLPFFKISNTFQLIKFLLFIPVLKIKIIRSFIWADHLHLRCPGNIGLIACFVQMFFPGKPKTAKYAGNWDPQANQPWSYKLQKWILSNTFLTRNMQVLVYGEWADQTKNVVPFFTASFSEKEREIINKDISVPYRFLFVGNLVPGKQPEVAIQIVEELYKRNIPAELHVYGDGELIGSLQDRAKNETYIHLHGNQPLDVLKQVYKGAHFLILASKSEGWPKAVAEAMFFGCIPIATSISCVPWMLGKGSRGILISDRNNNAEGNPVNPGERTVESQDGDEVERIVKRIIELISKEEEMKRMSMDAQEWSQQYTLEGFEEEIKKLLVPKEVRH